MKPEIRLLLTKQTAGLKLDNADIRTLMFAALDALKEFERLTLASIEKAARLLKEQNKLPIRLSVY